jgi:hypothetical protein
MKAPHTKLSLFSRVWTELQDVARCHDQLELSAISG